MKRIGQWLTGLLAVVAIAAVAYYNGPEAERRALLPSPLPGGTERDNRVIGEQDLQKLFPDVVLRLGRSGEKLVALTFDDGPDKTYTPAVLDILKQKGIKATFFLIGKRVQEDPAVVRRIVDEGHLIGNHTYSHPRLLKEGPGLQDELSKMEDTLKPFGVTAHTLFRPPYGAANPSLVTQASNLGYKLALWSVDSLDWQGLSASQVARNVLNYVSAGAVVLQHSAGGPGENLSGSISALPQIIDTLQSKGYRFVTFAEMFSLAKPDP